MPSLTESRMRERFGLRRLDFELVPQCIQCMRVEGGYMSQISRLLRNKADIHDILTIWQKWVARGGRRVLD